MQAHRASQTLHAAYVLLMVHVRVHVRAGADERYILEHLRSGDILTHCFHGRSNRMGGGPPKTRSSFLCDGHVNEACSSTWGMAAGVSRGTPRRGLSSITSGPTPSARISIGTTWPIPGASQFAPRVPVRPGARRGSSVMVLSLK